MIYTFSDRPSLKASRQSKLHIYHFCEVNNPPNFENEGKVTPLLGILLKEVQRVHLFQIGGHQRTFKLTNDLWQPCPTLCWPKRVENVHSPKLYGPKPSPACGVPWRRKLRKRKTEMATRAATTRRAAVTHRASWRWSIRQCEEDYNHSVKTSRFTKNILSFSWRDRLAHSTVCPFCAWRQWFPSFLSLPTFGRKRYKVSQGPSKPQKDFQPKERIPVNTGINHLYYTS